MKTPSLVRVIQNDPLSLVAAIALLTSVAFYAWGVFMKAPHPDVLFWITMPFAALAFLGLISRYKFIASIFEDDIEAKAVLTRVIVNRGNVIAAYSYNYMGQAYNASISIVSNDRARALAVGQAMQVVLYRANPRISFPKELFL